MLGYYYLIGILVVGVIVEIIIVTKNYFTFGTYNSDKYPTISIIIWRTAQKYPWLAFVAGALAWHFLGS